MLNVITHVAWRNLLRKPKRFVSTIIGVGVSVLLVIIQISLLFGFVSAAENIVRGTDTAIWITPFGVPALEFPSILEKRHLERVFAAAGITDVQPIVTGFAEYTAPSGSTTAVAVIGIPRSDHLKLPLPTHSPATNWHWGDVFVYDRSGAELLGIGGPGVEAQLNGRRIVSGRAVVGFGSFLGSPYIFVPLKLAQEVLGLGHEKVNYFTASTSESADPEITKRTLQEILPNHVVYTTDEFAGRSSWFWLVRTGAGGGFLLSAILGLIVGMVIVYQTTYSNAMENAGEYATLKAIGASSKQLLGVVALETAISGALGGAVGIGLSYPAVFATQAHFVSWIVTPDYLRLATFALGILMSLAAAMGAIRMVLRTDPIRVFRG